MNTSQIIGALGVTVKTVDPKLGWDVKTDGSLGFLIGNSTGIEAEIRWKVTGLSPVVYWYPYIKTWSGSIANVLHETIHVVLGPDSLIDESVLMAYQYALICCVDGPERAVLRKEFADFSMDSEDYSEIGTDDAIFQTEDWKSGVEDPGLDSGVVVKRRGHVVPVFGLGPHPSWTQWLEENRDMIEARAEIERYNARRLREIENELDQRTRP